MAKKPNLFIIGAAKSGTTSLHYALAAHPEVFLSEPKEPGFFVPEVTYYPSDESWYLGLFERAGGARYRGESSTHYTKIPLYRGVPDRIAKFVDEEPRFIYLMRDPIDRAVSNYWHNLRKHQEHRGILEAFREVPEYLSVSDYVLQLEPYMERFDHSTIFTATFEELVAQPDAIVAAVLKWLGLEPAVAELEKRNARPREFTRVRGRGLLHRFAASPTWDRLSPLAPRWVKRMGRRLGYATGGPEQRALAEAVTELRPRMRDRVYELEGLLGRSFDEWTTTLGEATPDLRTGA